MAQSGNITVLPPKIACPQAMPEQASSLVVSPHSHLEKILEANIRKWANIPCFFQKKIQRFPFF